MSKLSKLAASVGTAALLLTVIALAAVYRPPTPDRAAPAASAASTLSPQSDAGEKSAAPLPPVAVDDAATPRLSTDLPTEPPLSPDVPAEPPTSECRSVRTFVDRAPMTVEDRVRSQDGAVLATVLDVGPGQWNTPDGQPPADVDAVSARYVFRLARLSVDHVWSGDVASTFTASIVGGTIGCWTFKSDEVPEIVAGRQFAVFLRGRPTRAGLEDVRAAITLWPVDGEGRIVTAEEGPLTMAGFTQRFEQADAN